MRIAGHSHSSLGRAPTGPRLAVAALVLLGAVGVAASTAGRARAGAWTQPQGHGYTRFSFAGIDSRSRFDAAGARGAYPAQSVEGEARYEGREFRGYGEYGITGRLTAHASAAYKALLLEERAVLRRTSGFGDLHTGARWRLTRGGPPVSLAGEVLLPLGYSTADIPALGAGDAAFTLRALAGASRGPLYITADGGYRWRGGVYRDQVVGSLEAGGRFTGMYGGRAVLRWQRSVGASSPRGGDPGGFDPALASPRLLTLDGVVNLEIMPGLELEAGISHALSGRSALAGNTVELALVGFGAFAAGR